MTRVFKSKAIGVHVSGCSSHGPGTSSYALGSCHHGHRFFRQIGHKCTYFDVHAGDA